MPSARINPCVATLMALSWTRRSWMCVELHVAFQFDTLHIPCLSQRSHWLVLECARPFEVWPSSSSHVLDLVCSKKSSCDLVIIPILTTKCPHLVDDYHQPII